MSVKKNLQLYNIFDLTVWFIKEEDEESLSLV